jgi:hypothetical protein
MEIVEAANQERGAGKSFAFTPGTAREVASSEEVEGYIRSLKWSDYVGDEARTLVVGNIRAFAVWLRTRKRDQATDLASIQAEIDRQNAADQPELWQHARDLAAQAEELLATVERFRQFERRVMKRDAEEK